MNKKELLSHLNRIDIRAYTTISGSTYVGEHMEAKENQTLLRNLCIIDPYGKMHPVFFNCFGVSSALSNAVIETETHCSLPLKEQYYNLLLSLKILSMYDEETMVQVNNLQSIDAETYMERFKPFLN